MATRNLSKIVDANGDEYNIKAKGLESQIQIALSGDVTGSATTDLSGNVTISSTISNGAVTTSKIADSAVTTGKVNDKAITLGKIADAAKGGSVADNDGVLATHSAVKSYVDAQIAGQGHYLGKQTVAVINTWTADNLNNGDRVICEDSGTVTLGNIAVRAGEDLIFWKTGTGDSQTAIWQTMDGEFKLKQTAKTDPTASGTTITAIDTISQDTNGEITATKKTIRSASTSQTGVVQLAGSIAATVSSENNKAASEKAVRDAINALDAEVTSTNGTNVQVKVTETNGKVSAVAITTDNTESKNNKVTSFQTTPDNTHYPSEKLVKDSLDGKADKVSSATAGNFAGLDANGNLTDSGSKASDFATAAQGATADSAIQSVKVDGTALTPDENKAVDIDLANAHVKKADQLNTARNIDGVSFNGTANIHHYGECSTAAGTAAKTVTLSNSMSFTLAAGASVFVKFTNSNSVANPTLAVNGTTAKSIKRYGTTAPSTSSKTSWYSGSVLHLVYDGDYWQIVGWLNDDTTYTNASLGQGYGTCATAEATAAKVVTLSSYELKMGGIVAVKFTYGLCASATMNVNSKGAKNIFIHGAAATATTCKEVLAGDIAYFIYDGTQYHLLGTDHAERKFSINYRSSDNALVFTKAFGTTT